MAEPAPKADHDTAARSIALAVGNLVDIAAAAYGEAAVLDELFSLFIHRARLYQGAAVTAAGLRAVAAQIESRLP